MKKKKNPVSLPGPALLHCCEAPRLPGMPAGQPRRRWSSSKERINLSSQARGKYGSTVVAPPPPGFSLWTKSGGGGRKIENAQSGVHALGALQRNLNI